MTESNTTDGSQFFLSTYGLDAGGLARVVGTALGRQNVDWADLYFEHAVLESVSLEESLVKKVNRLLNQGVGVRAVAHDKTGYAHADTIELPELEAAAQTARVIATTGARDAGPIAIRLRAPGRDLYPVPSPATERRIEDKATLLREIDTLARGLDARVREVQASFVCEQKTVAVLSSDGELVGDVRPLARLNVSIIAEDHHGRQVGTSGGGNRVDFDWFVEPVDRGYGTEARWRFFVREAVRRAVLALDADPAPAGTMPVVLGPGWPGILLHEAIGHGLEGDFNRKGVSAFANRLGTLVASPLCTVVDDGTLSGRRGSLNVDDEGSPTQRTVLIQDGVLTGYMQDRTNARLMGVPCTGNGRRESYAHMPMPRMTNTFMLPGESTPEDIVRSVKRGIYATSFGGGQVDITNGKFVFSMNEAYLIEDGRIGRPLRGATLIGSGPEVLKKVSMVGHDLALDEGVGTCGKEGQSVPVGVGLPTIRVDEITVGGTR